MAGCRGDHQSLKNAGTGFSLKLAFGSLALCKSALLASRPV